MRTWLFPQLITLAMTSTACATHVVPPRDAFAARVAEYMEMRTRIVSRLGTAHPTSSANALTAHADDVAIAIQRLRRGFGEGVIIPAAVAHGIRLAVSTRLREGDGLQLLAAVREVTPAGFSPTVNSRYPDGQPRTTMPAPLLAVLPPVPTSLAYRFANRSLLLLDRDTGVILDFVEDVLPADTPR